VAIPENGVISTGNAILSNSVFSDNLLGIELSALSASEAATPNNAGDGDIGGTDLQHYPVLTSVASTNIEGSRNGATNTEFRLEFFANTACGPSGNSESETFLDSHTVTTDGMGNFSSSANLPAAFSAGQFNTSTATDPAGNTSEFSECIVATETIAVKIDLSINQLNLGSNGVLPVAVLGGAGLELAEIDVGTLSLNGAEPVHNGHVEDVNGDSSDDLVVHFAVPDMVVDPQPVGGDIVPITLTGEMSDGTPLSGEDVVAIKLAKANAPQGGKK